MEYIDRVARYHDTAKAYRRQLRGICDSCEKKLQSIEQYKGSAGYEDDVNQYLKERDDAIEELHREYQAKFNDIVKGMRERATSHNMVPPTAEQLSLLQALKMRDKINRHELEQAARTLKDCPVGLSIIDELAQKHKIYGLRCSGLSTSAILDNIDTLQKSANDMCTLTNPDRKSDFAAKMDPRNPDYVPSVRMVRGFRINKDTESEAESMELYGGIPIDQMSAFRHAVNG